MASIKQLTYEKINVPTFKLSLPSNNQEIIYRPYMVEEEQILMMALEGASTSDNDEEILHALRQIATNCIVSPTNINITSLPLYDLQYFFIKCRSKGVGNMVELNYQCQAPSENGEICKTEVKHFLDLDTVEVTKDPSHDPTIRLTPDVGILMKYPSLDILKRMNKTPKTETEATFELIAECVENVFDSETVYEDVPKEEILELLKKLTIKQFNQIKHFFETIPEIAPVVEIKCPKCGNKQDIKIEGLSSFFASSLDTQV